MANRKIEGRVITEALSVLAHFNIVYPMEEDGKYEYLYVDLGNTSKRDPKAFYLNINHLCIFQKNKEVKNIVIGRLVGFICTLVESINDNMFIVKTSERVYNVTNKNYIYNYFFCLLFFLFSGITFLLLLLS
jgi:hypothetical protein